MHKIYLEKITIEYHVPLAHVLNDIKPETRFVLFVCLLLLLLFEQIKHNNIGGKMKLPIDHKT